MKGNSLLSDLLHITALKVLSLQPVTEPTFLISVVSLLVSPSSPSSEAAPQLTAAENTPLYCIHLSFLWKWSLLIPLYFIQLKWMNKEIHSLINSLHCIWHNLQIMAIFKYERNIVTHVHLPQVAEPFSDAPTLWFFGANSYRRLFQFCICRNVYISHNRTNIIFYK